MRLARYIALVFLCLALLLPACGSGPAAVSVSGGERSATFRGTEVVQYYTWWADLKIENKTGQTIYTTLDDISYGKGQDVSQAGIAEAGGKVYAREGWVGGKRKPSAGRADERMSIPSGASVELKGVGFESHPESSNGTIRVSVEGQGIVESSKIDFMSFPTRQKT